MSRRPGSWLPAACSGPGVARDSAVRALRRVKKRASIGREYSGAQGSRAVRCGGPGVPQSGARCPCARASLPCGSRFTSQQRVARASVAMTLSFAPPPPAPSQAAPTHTTPTTSTTSTATAAADKHERVPSCTPLREVSQLLHRCCARTRSPCPAGGGVVGVGGVGGGGVGLCE